MSYQSQREQLADLPQILTPESSRRLIRKPGNVLRELRLDSAASVAAIAAGTRISERDWIAFESGEARPDRLALEAMATFFDVELPELLALFHHPR